MAEQIYNDPNLTYEPNIQYNGIYDSWGNVLGRVLNDKIKIVPSWEHRRPKYIHPRN